MQRVGTVCVYEAVNEPLQEAFVGAFEGDFASILTLHRLCRPKPIRHWSDLAKVRYRCVEEALPLTVAAEFMNVYARHMRRIGWKMFVEPPQARP